MYLLISCGVGYICATAYMWKSNKNLQELVLSFHYVGPGDKAQIMGLAISTFQAEQEIFRSWEELPTNGIEEAFVEALDSSQADCCKKQLVCSGFLSSDMTPP